MLQAYSCHCGCLISFFRRKVKRRQQTVIPVLKSIIKQNFKLNKINFNSKRQNSNLGLNHCNFNTDYFALFHQNIRGLENKIDEFNLAIHDACNCKNQEIKVICLTEHHSTEMDLKQINISNFSLCSSFCRSSIKCGGVSIFVKKTLNFCNFDISSFCREQDFECCAAKVKFDYGTYIILTVYRAPSGNFSYFINQLERVLNQLYSNNANILVCGDFNVNFATDTERKVRLISLLDSFNLDLTVKFPTRIQNNSITTIDNIFIDKSNFPNFSTFPIINGLSDHDAQLLILCNDIDKSAKKQNSVNMTRKINESSILSFKSQLLNETWETVYSQNGVNNKLNEFLSIVLRYFEANFPKKSISKTSNLKIKSWLTTGIRTSCANKKKLYLTSRTSNDPNFKLYYKKYCFVLKKVIKAAKNMYFSQVINKSNNKIKTIWNIIKNETGKSKEDIEHSSLTYEDVNFTHPRDIANAFNSHFINIADNCIPNNNPNVRALDLLIKSSNNSYPKSRIRTTCPSEIEKNH